MAGKLTALKLKTLVKAGRYGDGNGLWLQVRDAEHRSWLFRYTRNGQHRQMGLGPADLVSLAEARQAAIDCRRQLLRSTDPIEARRLERTAPAVESKPILTFRTCAEKYVAAHRAGWRSPKHAKQWEATLQTYVFPTIGSVAVAAIDTGLVTQILEPVWTKKSETASRVRGRVEAVLDYAATHGWRAGENPARWKGHLDNVLPARGKVRKVAHHAALSWGEIGAFMADLAGQAGVAALALRFAILTAARTGEVIGARWSEIDLQAAVWTVPEDRMKAGREHRVPLADDTLAVLRQAAELRERSGPDAFVFPGGNAGRGLSNMALLVLLRRMERGDLTAHGFRSTFRDWAAESTGYPREMAEAALAHVVGDRTVAAYQRGDLLERRRRLMTAWAAFCARPAPTSAEVIDLRRA